MSDDERGSQHPLRGCLVLDFTVNAAGPYASWLLASLGADVIKVESHNRQDPGRGSEDRPYIHSNFFEDANTGKRSVALDLKVDDDRRLALELAARSAIVVSSFRPGVMDRLGLGYDAIHERNPATVVACLSATGAAGPHAGLPGYAGVFNALGGLGGLTGYEDGPPTELRTSIDMRAGAMLAAMITWALRQARRTGEGRLIDFAASECVSMLAGEHLTATLLGADDVVPRLGNRDEAWSPHGTFASADDGWVTVAVRDDDEWERLVSLAAADGVEVEPDLATAVRRRERVDDAESIVAQWVAGRSAADAESLLVASGVPATQVLGAREVARDPHLEARGFYWETPRLRTGSPCRVASAPWIIDRERRDLTPARPLGADTETVLAEVLGPEARDAYRSRSVSAAQYVGGAS